MLKRTGVPGWARRTVCSGIVSTSRTGSVRTSRTTAAPGAACSPGDTMRSCTTPWNGARIVMSSRCWRSAASRVFCVRYDAKSCAAWLRTSW